MFEVQIMSTLDFNSIGYDDLYSTDFYYLVVIQKYYYEYLKLSHIFAIIIYFTQ